MKENMGYRSIAPSIEEYYLALWLDMLSHFFGWSKEEAHAWLIRERFLDFDEQDMVFHDDPPYHLYGVMLRALLGEDYGGIDAGFWISRLRSHTSGDHWLDIPLDFDWEDYIADFIAFVSDLASQPYEYGAEDDTEGSIP